MNTESRSTQSLSSVEQKEKLKLNILVAEDDPVLRHMFKMMLESLGHTVTEVENGDLLIDKLFQSGEVFDIVFSDNSMPGRTGIEALREIRSTAKFKTLPFVLVTTDNAVEGSLKEETEFLSGVFIPKPFVRKQLADAIKELIENKA